MVILPDHHHAEAKRKVAHEGISLSEYIRRLVASDLDHADTDFRIHRYGPHKTQAFRVHP